MNLNLLELNELIYCVSTGINKGKLVNKAVAQKLLNRLQKELLKRNAEIEQLMDAEANAVQRWG
jgi:hypothetical protein